MGIGQHSGSVVSTVTLQQEGPGFEPYVLVEDILCGVSKILRLSFLSQSKDIFIKQTGIPNRCECEFEWLCRSVHQSVRLTGDLHGVLCLLPTTYVLRTKKCWVKFNPIWVSRGTQYWVKLVPTQYWVKFTQYPWV